MYRDWEKRAIGSIGLIKNGVVQFDHLLNIELQVPQAVFLLVDISKDFMECEVPTINATGHFAVGDEVWFAYDVTDDVSVPRAGHVVSLTHYAFRIKCPKATITRLHPFTIQTDTGSFRIDYLRQPYAPTVAGPYMEWDKFTTDSIYSCAWHWQNNNYEMHRHIMRVHATQDMAKYVYDINNFKSCFNGSKTVLEVEDKSKKVQDKFHQTVMGNLPWLKRG